MLHSHSFNTIIEMLVIPILYYLYYCQNLNFDSEFIYIYKNEVLFVEILMFNSNFNSEKF